MNRTPIEPNDIRKGDHIRLEWTRSQCGSPRALEYVALADNMAMRKKLNEAERRVATWFLLDRPKPVVELPTKPTLGWVTFQIGSRYLGVWSPSRFQGSMEGTTSGGYISDSWQKRLVTAFTPATAVPAEALAHFRSEVARAYSVVARESAHNVRHDAIVEFLEAIDEATA